MNSKYILASGSPRRIEMMKNHGFNPEILPADIEENIPVNHGMKDTVMFLSLKKAQWVREKYLNDYPDADDHTIIAADTIVYYDGEIMGKPKDFDDGFNMLSKLNGKCHQVATGVTILDLLSGEGKTFVEVTDVYFKKYTDEWLIDYLHTDEAYDKAGGYAIQGQFAECIDHFDGDYNTVIGFPWDRILKELKD